ncbi:cytochrome P450 [Allokutzneria sp. A3M-2-11 16]|uniref:cytochrome P450 n=1 Tax=Allokutzneria sp. A3M-2-11 16 TaxID=2962043 RepID=UPI0020B6489E|nr:cytochrome P450 [Allokutzneria sp. A3M-2-11 16]MCP3799806.1 cytochrome P450 [Allokutzneria sp. A3M-2-11 16]
MNKTHVPFTEPGAYEPSALADYYDSLHSSNLSTFLDQKTGMQAVWRYDDVEKIAKGAGPAVSTRNTLDPLTPFPKFATHLTAIPHIAHLATVPRATNNADKATHSTVMKAMFARPRGLSMRPDATRTNFGAIVARRVEVAADALAAAAAESGGPVDYEGIFARPLASGVISELLGFPAEEEGQIKAWSDAQIALLARIIDRPDRVATLRGLSDLSRACRRLVTARSKAPAQDLASHLLAQGLAPKLAAAALMNIMVAGYSSSYGALLNSTRYLLSDEGREHWDVLREPERVPAMLEDILRKETGVVAWRRYAEQDVVLADGSVVPKGSSIFIMIGAANRDPRRFPDPHAVLPGRGENDGAKAVTFGSGPHMCAGREVAKLEITTALTTLRERFPDMRLALPDNGISYDPDYMLRTPQTLPVLL